MLKISFIIPCKNEEKHIYGCINSLLNQKAANIEIEIIVVDNGSTDNTLKILQSYHGDIKIYVCPNLSIAGLRNFGVKNSKNDWIAFIDADVEVANNWGNMLCKFIDEKESSGNKVNNIITGSTCLVPDNPTWIESVWYEQLIARDSDETKYINSGNMVIHKDLFNIIGGFDISYKTGEEENLCAVARNRYDGIICKNNNLKAIHHGYPKSIAAFFRRMRWHGTGMSKYLLTPWKSKPLMLALYYVFITAIFIVFSLTNFRRIPIYFALFIILQVIPVMLYSYTRSDSNIKKAVMLAVLYVCFGWARAISLVDYMFHKNIYQIK